MLAVSCSNGGPGTTGGDSRNGDTAGSGTGGDAHVDALPPTAAISAPGVDAVFAYGDAIVFSGQVSDAIDSPSELTIRWLSDLDGVLSVAAAAADGSTTFTSATLVPGVHHVTLEATNTHGLAAEAVVPFTITPGADAPVVSISPATATTADTLTVAIVPDPTNPTYLVEWRRNGEVATATGTGTNSEILPDQTTRDEVWSVRVVAQSAGGDSSPGTAQTQIFNSVPVCNSASFVPATGTTLAAFACVCTDRFDADDADDTIDRCELSINGAPLDPIQGCDITSDLTLKDDALDCNFFVGDGTDEAAAVAAPQLVIASSPPSIASVEVVTDGCGRFTCTVTGLADIDAADANNLSAAFRWERNGAPIAGTTETVTATGSAQGDAIGCFARPTDGTVLADGSTLYGDEVAGTPIAVNVPVSAVASVSLLPAAPVAGDLLTCAPSGFNDAGCGWAPSYTYRWLDNGASISGATNAELQLDPAAAGPFQCEATPNGGSVPGLPVLSNTVNLVTVDPGAPVVEILAPDGADGDVTCNIRVPGAASMIGAIWNWQLNSDAPYAASQILGASVVAGCDRVRCWVDLPNGGSPVSSNTAEKVLTAAITCDDGNPCTASACDPAGGCEYTPVAGSCDDGGVCTASGTCVAGVCQTTPIVCDDGDPCSDDSCDPIAGCVTAPGTGTPCDDGNSCTTGDTCTVGVCGGLNTCGCTGDTECDDGNSCTDDICSAGTCTNSDNTAACDDGDACTTGDVCNAGACGGTSQSCTTYYADADGDTFGTAVSVCTCEAQPANTATRSGDCDDTNAAVNPDATELSDDGIDSNCDSKELFNGNLLDVAGPLTGSTYDVPISGSFDMGSLGIVTVAGSVQKDGAGLVSWCVNATISQTLGTALTLNSAVGQVCMDQTGQIITSLTGSADVAGYPVEVAGSFSLTAPNDYSLLISGSATVDGTPLPILSGSSLISRTSGAEYWRITVSAGAVILVPGVVLESTEFIIEATGITLAATTRFGVAPNDVGMDATGVLNANGDYSLTLALAAGETWDPFGSVLPVTFTTVSGALARTGGVVSATVVGAVATDLQIVPGLTLTAASVTGTVASDGTWSVALSGSTGLDLGDGVPRTVTITGSVDSAGIVGLTGEVTGAWEPLAVLIGSGRFIIDGQPGDPFAVGLLADIPGGTFTVTFDSPMIFCVFNGCTPAEQLVASVHAEGTLGGSGGFSGYFIANLASIDLPGFGPLPGVAFGAATVDTPAVDLFGDGSEIRDLPRGVTLAAFADSPLDLAGLVGPYLFIISVEGTTQLTVTADFGLFLPIITSADNFPSIEYANMTSVYFFATLRPGTIDMGFGSDVEFKPTNQALALLGNVQFAVSPTLTASGTMSILGRWLDPFFLRNFAVQNPGFTMALNFSGGGVPVPTSIGWNIDVYWKKSGGWPPLMPPEPGAPPVPPNIITVGNSFFYDAIPSESGFCLVGACVPTPPILFRFNLQNLTLDDMVTFTNDAVQAVATPLAAVLPSADIDPLDPSPVTVDINTIMLEASTHTMVFFGQPITAGVRMNFDANVMGISTLFEGSLDPDGLLVRGYQDGFSLPGVALVGDPLWHDMFPGSGSVDIPHDAALAPSKGMIEGWVRNSTWSGTPTAAELARKYDGTNGWIFGVGQQVGGLGKLVLQIFNGPSVRTVVSEDAVVDINIDEHIAWQFNGADVGLYHNGARLKAVDSGPVVAPGSNSAALRIGLGMDRVDDFRVWNTNRSPAEVGAQARNLPTSFINPLRTSNPGSPLVARYEFDWDTSSVAYNSRLRSGASLNGSYVGGATHQLRVIDNPKSLLIDITNPIATGRTPGFGLEAGIDVNLPLGPFGGTFTMGAYGKFAFPSAAFEFYLSDTKILPLGIPGTPTHLGDFQVGGYGENLVDDNGGRDDGVYGSIDFGINEYAGTSRFEFEAAGSGTIDRFAQGTFLYTESPAYMFADGDINLFVPFVDSDLGIAGAASFETTTLEMSVSGDVVIFGYSFAGVDVTISQNEATFTAGWALPDPPFLADAGIATLAGMSTSYTISFVDQSFCASVHVDIAGQWCDIGACFYTSAFPEFTGNCSFVTLCGNNSCEAAGVPPETCLTCQSDCGTCPNGTPCVLDSECSSGHCTALFCSDCGNGSCSGAEVCSVAFESLPVGMCYNDCGQCTGAPCTVSSECHGSDVCNIAFCVPYHSLPVAVPCDTDDACQSGSCSICDPYGLACVCG